MDGWDRAPEGCWEVLERFTKTVKFCSREGSAFGAPRNIKITFFPASEKPGYL